MGGKDPEDSSPEREEYLVKMAEFIHELSLRRMEMKKEMRQNKEKKEEK